MVRPPYERSELLPGALDRVTELEERLTDGCILLASPLSIKPRPPFHELSWLRRAMPQAALAVRAPLPIPPATAGSVFTRLARCGAVIVVDSSSDTRQVALTVREAFDAEADVPRWLAAAVPRWPVRERMAASEDLFRGFQYDPEDVHLRQPLSPLPSAQRIWIRAGRALRSALMLQVEGFNGPGASDLHVAHSVGYADGRSMNRALRRLFGVSGNEIRGTVGWEWLLWRFLTDSGEGRLRL